MIATLSLLVLAPLGADAGNSVAPPLSGVFWSRSAGSAERQVEQVSTSSSTSWMPKQPRGAGLDAWAGRPVLILQLPNDRGHAEAIAFAQLLGRANADRGLILAALLPKSSTGGSGETTPEPIVPDLVTGLVPDESPWVPGGGVTAVVLGPSGERIGSAALPGGEDAVVDLLHVALNRHPAPRLEADLPEPLRAAQAQYFAGEWSRARKAAERVASKAARKDAALAAAATGFIGTLDAFERDLQNALVEADGDSLRLERLATLATVIERGFPKSPGAKSAKSITARQKKNMGRAMAWSAAEEYVEILPERPVLFPERADSSSKKYAKKLQSMTNRAATFEGDVTRKARALLVRHEAANARR